MEGPETEIIIGESTRVEAAAASRLSRREAEEGSGRRACASGGGGVSDRGAQGTAAPDPEVPSNLQK